MLENIRKKLLEPILLEIKKIGGGTVEVDKEDPSVITYTGQEAEDRRIKLSAFNWEREIEDKKRMQQSPYSVSPELRDSVQMAIDIDRRRDVNES